ncbi:DUF6986 family protein [Corynebacterium pacaense]|uniref:DUF6986 family protein n=1 Tax=Corynebacterium pacaense TaxID=1816684 RepID=UPI0011780425|nr:aldolase/citrate lyase family protein [Corynebacterium pacaense]
MTIAQISPDVRALMEESDSLLEGVDRSIATRWSTPVTWRQPVHTVYVPVDKLSGPGTVSAWADTALTTLVDAYGGDPVTAATELAVQLGEPEEVGGLVVDKLRKQAIEDLRIDFEDGFTQNGLPPRCRDADEDDHAHQAVDILAKWLSEEGAPAFAGVRIKSFSPETRARGLRTLAIIVRGLAEAGTLRELADSRALRITLPKVQHHLQVTAMVAVLERLEDELGLEYPLKFEVQIETPQAILGADGSAEPAHIITAAQGRLLALHYGTYDYSAALGIDPAQQSLEHPVAHHAKDVLQVACSCAGVELSDGSLNRIPFGNSAELLSAWRLHHRYVHEQLARGIRQGWDLHPNQLITRHLATIGYYVRGSDMALQRLHDYTVGVSTRWMDEPATARPLARFLLRGLDCGAVSSTDLRDAGLNEDILRRI